MLADQRPRVRWYSPPAGGKGSTGAWARAKLPALPLPCLQWLKKYAALVRFVSVDEVRREFFTPETMPPEFAAEGFPPRPK